MTDGYQHDDLHEIVRAIIKVRDELEQHRSRDILNEINDNLIGINHSLGIIAAYYQVEAKEKHSIDI